MSDKNISLGKRWFAGQVARAGESGIIALSYINAGKDIIKGGRFVAMGEGAQTVKNITEDSDKILGVVTVMGVHHEFKVGKNLSVMVLPHGAEIVAEMAKSSELSIGDEVKIVAIGEDSGTISHAGTIETQFYVTDVNGSLAKIMRSEVVKPASVTSNEG
jgi:hypothetical protein